MAVEPRPPACTSIFCPGADVGEVDEALLSGERHQGYGGGLGEGERGGLDRDVVGVDRDRLGEGADPQVTWSCVDLVAKSAPPWSRGDKDRGYE
ncbi:hypothetical protein [Nonomuraea sp. NPDC049158]|uniref:hypothetical protein n=1 Tax=Nonomuraea sp. NPDC049158 TaxID=3155649 RepID=UPI003403946B